MLEEHFGQPLHCTYPPPRPQPGQREAGIRACYSPCRKGQLVLRLKQGKDFCESHFFTEKRKEKNNPCKAPCKSGQ